MVPTTEETEIVISPSPIPKEEDTDLSNELIPEKELLSTSDQSKELRQFNIYKMHSNFNLEF